MSLILFPPSSLYLVALTGLSLALGIQIVLLPWLVVDYLSLSSVWVGWIQSAVLIPNLLFLLLGGISADRNTSSQWPIRLIIVNAVIHGLLAIMINNNLLTFFVLAMYAVLLGLTNAFIQPWREYLLKQIDDAQLQKMVAKSSLCLYGGQAIGVLITTLLLVVGIETLLLLQVLFTIIAAISFYFLTRQLTLEEGSLDKANTFSSQYLLIDGLKNVWNLPALKHLLMIVAFNGFFHIGVFIVALPLLVKQVYAADVDLFSGLQLAFVLGTIATTMTVILRGFLDAPGRRVIFCLLYGGVILLALSAKPTLWGLYILVFVWGAVVGVSANMGRSILQSLAPQESRGRFISIYQLALFGFAPIGALFAGYGIDLWGVLAVLKISGIASFVMFFLMLLTRELWDVEVANKNH